MLCERCKQNFATINITHNINGTVTKVNICDICSVEIAVAEYAQKTFKALFGKLQDIAQDLTQENNANICSICSLTYEDFTNGGNLGCSDCYQSFSHILKKVLQETQAGDTHKGEIPWRTHQNLIKERRIEALEQEKQRAVEQEDFDLAAELRDQIRRETI